MNEILKQFFDFSLIMGKARELERFKGQFFWEDYPDVKRYESITDHSWRVAMLVLLFENKLSQKIDTVKALKMALIHDLPEVFCGDESPLGKDGTGKNTHAFNDEKAQQRYQEEKMSAEKLFKMLPDQIGNELLDLWLEYEKQENFESKVVKSLDKLEATISVLEYREGNMFPEHLEFTASYGTKGSEVDPAIAEFGKIIIEEMKSKYKEFKK